jgi:hypothetical protein
MCPNSLLIRRVVCRPMAGKMIVLVSLVGMIVGMPVVNAEEGNDAQELCKIYLDTADLQKVCKDTTEIFCASFVSGSISKVGIALPSLNKRVMVLTIPIVPEGGPSIFSAEALTLRMVFGLGPDSGAGAYCN